MLSNLRKGATTNQVPKHDIKDHFGSWLDFDQVERGNLFRTRHANDVQTVLERNGWRRRKETPSWKRWSG
jgi:hypothetical protein